MLKIAVCDDSPIFLESAVGYIKKWSDETETPTDIHTYSNGDDLIRSGAVAAPDIVFLDIIMPLLSGMDTARELRQKNTAVKIIFLTSSPEFALESYEVKAQGYLLKPVSYEKMKETLNECAAAYAAEPENIILKTSFGFQKIYLHDIEYAEAQNKKVIFFLKNGGTVGTAEPLRSFEHKLTDANGFFKCHRSYLVYIPNIDRFNSSEIITCSGRKIPIARGYAKPFKEAYFLTMFGCGES